MAYTDVFGGSVIQTSAVSYSSLALTSVVALDWPMETVPNSTLVTQIIDVTSATAGSGVQLPDATAGSPGYAFIVSNDGSNPIVVNNNASGTIATVAPGAVYFVYLKSNLTSAGTWGSFQYGAAISAPSAAAIAGSGLTAVGTTLAQSIPVNTLSTNYSLGSSDLASLINWIGGVGTLTFPVASAIGSSWYVQVRNSGSSSISVSPTSPSTINGSASLTMNPGDSAFIVSDGTNFYTVGLGSAATSTFTFVAISVAGLSGTYTLSGTSLGKIVYRFTGTKAGALQIVVPSTVAEYWVDNETDSTYALTVGVSGQASPITVNYGARSILYCDGTNVVNGDTSSIAIPLTISQGGTGATTSSNALTNLGGTTLGVSIFTAANASAVRTAIAAPSTADAVVFSMVMG